MNGGLVIFTVVVVLGAALSVVDVGLSARVHEAAEECAAARVESAGLLAQCVAEREHFRTALVVAAETIEDCKVCRPDPYADLKNKISIQQMYSLDLGVPPGDGHLPPEEWCALYIASPSVELGDEWERCVDKLMREDRSR